MNKENKTDEFNDLDFKKIFDTLWDSKKFIIKSGVLSGIFFALFSLTITNTYLSKSVLTIVTDSEISSVPSSLGGLASLAGIKLPSPGGDKSKIIVETISSRAFLERLLNDELILPSLMAYDYYDKKTQDLVLDSSKLDLNTLQWKTDIPNMTEIYEEYTSIISIQEDSLSGMIFLSVEHVSPIFAKQFLSLIISELNELIRARELSEATSSIEFLKAEINKTSLTELKAAMNKLIETELQKQMIANINKDYALMAIEPPYIPDNKENPKRTLITILGGILGGLLSVFWVLYTKLFKKSEIDF